MPTLRDIFLQAAAGQRLRQMLTDAAARLDYTNATVRQQVEQIDMAALQERIERMVDRAAIIAHAFDVMEQGAHPHPLSAFIHSIECTASNVSDKEFQHLLTLWACVCSECVKPEELTARAQAPIESPDYGSIFRD